MSSTLALSHGSEVGSTMVIWLRSWYSVSETGVMVPDAVSKEEGGACGHLEINAFDHEEMWTPWLGLGHVDDSA